MATNSVKGKRDLAEEEAEEEDQEEEEEALSLCDLPNPVTAINHNNQPKVEDHPDHVNEPPQPEEFDFSGIFSKQPEMCVADEVFFQGQILPFRHSFSSESGLLTSHGNNNRCKSRSDSLVQGYGSLINEFHSSSSRSSSLRSSQNSSTSTSSTATATATRISKPRFPNQFHTHPSPKPQLKSSGPRQASFGRKSSVWEIFRLGVVPAPEIGLQDLKVRSSKNCVSRNSSNSSTNSSDKLSNKTATHHHGDKSNHFFKHLVGKGRLLSGCDCSIETVQFDDSDMAMIKGGGAKSTSRKESATTTHAVKEKVMVELKKQKQRKKQGKKVMSRRRTFEWLKELHASHLDDDDEAALLSKA